jgi:hypothetical protein
MTKQLKSLLIFGLITFFSSQGIAAEQDLPGTETSTSSTDTIWVWADEDAGKHPVFLTRGTDEEWQEATRLTDNDSINIVPAVTTYENGDIFVIWSAYINGQAHLLYKSLRDGVWGEEKRYYSGLESNTAPSTAIDADGKIWVVWAGFNGMNDEIYFTTSAGSEFETATAITSNDVPDIHPILGIDSESGLPWVQWRQFSESGYIDFQTAWNGSEWSEPQKIAAAPEEEQPDNAELMNSRNALIKKTILIPGEETSSEQTADITVPAIVTDPDSAAMHQPGNEVQSHPVRAMVRVE